MNENKQQIMTIDAKSLFKYFPKKRDVEDSRFCFDTRMRSMYTLVVKAEEEMEDCPLFYQFQEVLKEENNEIANEEIVSLRDHFLVMDFGDIFMPLKKDAPESLQNWKKSLLDNAKDIIENGFDVRYDDKVVHMVPFDKSGNMSRNSRISFVNEKYLKQLNERLNLGMNFSEINVILSKYYAYRGLYLSSSQRVEHEKFKITPETLVILYDNGKNMPPAYERNVLIATATSGDKDGEWIFQKPEEKDIEYVKTPLDGTGLIVPEYSKYINEALGIDGATSFQVRLPFTKGMMHQVDVLGFIDEFTEKGEGDNKYLHEDAFGIERDLSKACILLTESMFKGKDWLKQYCDKNNIEDPMQYYCDMLEEYNHGFYVSGTDLPYGKSKYTHLSYQVINTLAFEPEQFERIIKRHGEYIKNPIEYVKDSSISEAVRENDENDIVLPNWKRALIKDTKFAGDKYISEQLRNTQKSLLTKMATGKILVEGQTRYLCRDLFALMSTLLRNKRDSSDFYIKYLYTRFYMPQGKDNNSNIHLEFKKNCAFFRNPHLSRNEQYIMRPFVLPHPGDKYAKDGRKDYDNYLKCVEIYNKYFGHLTGIVMVPRGSSLPLCLGGADFDGDLVSIITDQDVVEAVVNGGYNENESPSLNWYNKKLSIIKIPATATDPEPVPELVSYEHIYNTFSNYIGQISNAAIAIGQEEYGRKGYVDEVFDADKATCAKCTLLTGLEIDAAKNGIHPNLEIVLNAVNGKSSYMVFLDGFRRLKSEADFSYDKLRIEDEKAEIDGKIQKTGNIVISAIGCKTEIVWDPSIEETGTYINLLPKYFLQYVSCYKKDKLFGDKFKIAHTKKADKEKKKLLKNFKNNSDAILKVYSFYDKNILKALSQEKNKGYYAYENTEKMVIRMYDKGQAEETLFVTIPGIKEKISRVISDKSAYEDIRERINNEQWQFQPMNRRGKTLEKIISNGFKESDLSEKEKTVLYHFNQQGYKLLWRIIDTMEGPKVASYDEIFKEEIEKTNKLPSEEMKGLNKILKNATKKYYENNADNIARTVYGCSLSFLKKEIEFYKSEGVDCEMLVVELYNKTKGNTNNAKFFWDAFSWEDMQCLFGEKVVKG